MEPLEGGVVLKHASGSIAARQFKKVRKKLRRLTHESEFKRRAGSVPSDRYLPHSFSPSSTQPHVIGNKEGAAVTSSPCHPDVTPSRELRQDQTFPFVLHCSKIHDSNWRDGFTQKAKLCAPATDEVHSDSTRTRADSAHSTGGGLTSCTQSRESSPSTRSRNRKNVVLLVRTLRPPEATCNSFLYGVAENATLSQSSEQESTTWGRRPENYHSDGSVASAGALTWQRCLVLLDKLVPHVPIVCAALMLSFVAMAACWGIIDVGVELIAHGKARLEILCYAILLLVSLGLITAAKRLRFVGPCDVAFAASVSLSFLSAVAGWGLVDAVVEFAAGTKASAKMLYYCCFLLCAAIFVLLHVCLLNPSFRLSAACFA